MRRKYVTVAGLVCVLAVMLTLVTYSVTLYRLFCEATGAGGTTQRVAADDVQASARAVTVVFNTDVAPGLPWRFVPVQDRVRTHLGQDTLVFFRAENRSDQDLVGHATFNVTPEKVGIYFKKVECFCFQEERLAAHGSVEMPVDFFVDPRMTDDPAARDVTQITLSYTFFASRAPEGAANLARFDAGPADAQAGRKLFDSVCAECHGAHAAKIGPALAGVIGRPAGSAPGYPYSQALAHAGLVWDAGSLDHWLQGPAKFIPGAQMPMAIEDPARRRDIIAYLQTLSPG